MKTETAISEPVLQKDLLTVVKFSSAFSLGTMAAFICSIREVNPHLRFALDFVTALAFVLGVGLSWALWRALLESSLENPRTRRWIGFLLGVVVAGTLAGYGYAIASLPQGRFREMVIGTTAAVIVLSLLGTLFWKVARSFESEESDSDTHLQ